MRRVENGARVGGWPRIAIAMIGLRDRDLRLDWRRRPVHSGHRHRVQVRVDRHRGNRRRALLAVESAARGVRRQAAQSRRQRLRAHRIHLRQSQGRLADGRLEEQRLGSARRTELRDLSCRRVSRGAGRRAEDRPGDARAPDGSSGLCAVPVGLCQRSHGSTPTRSSRPCRSIRSSDFSMASPTGCSRSARRGRAFWSGTRASPGSTSGRRRDRGAWIRSIRTRRCSRPRRISTADTTVGTADLPSLWNQRIRRGLWLHWDGNNDSVDERNKSAAIGAGATPESIDLAALDRIANWILDLKPPVVSGRPHQCRPGGHGTAALSAALRELPRRRPAEGGTDDRHRRDRHRSGAAQLLYAGTGEDDEHHRHGQAVEVFALPQDERLRRHAARRHLAAGAVSAQRFGADASRAAPARPAPGDVLPRLRRLRLSGRGFRLVRTGGREGTASCSRRPIAATATAGTPTARSCPSRIARRCSSTSRHM